MYHHPISVHNPVQFMQQPQGSAHKLRCAEKYNFHHLLKVIVILILSPHPIRTVRNAVSFAGGPLYLELYENLRAQVVSEQSKNL